MRVLGTLVLVATACAATPSGRAPSDACAIIERERDVPACVGKTVTVRGVVTRTKMPTIVGVDVEDEDLADQLAEATGVLTTFTVPEREPGATPVATRSPGTYYALRSHDGLAKPRRVKR